MRKHHFFTILLLLAALSCNNDSGDDDTPTPPDDNDGGGNDTPVEFVIKSSGSEEIVMNADRATDITETSAMLIGEFVRLSDDHEITQHGHVYGTRNAPTLDDMKTQQGARTSTGTFSSTLNGLSPETTYFFRAYIQNADGEVAYHPDTQSLTTLAEDDDEPDDPPCTSDIEVDQSRGDCSETLNFASNFTMEVSGNTRTITSNCIPDHRVGLFGRRQGAINPNEITEQSESYQITTEPSEASSFTALRSTSSGPQYSFGVLLNGVELDPVAAEPFPHNGITDPNVNWEWNLEAMYVNIGLDCNNAHVQPTGKYHYHGTPTLFLENANIPSDQMTLVGYAADGFPIYYKYAYADPNDPNSGVREMQASYQLKSGERPGDGVTAPCGAYTGVYSNDFEFNNSLGDLDQANGRTGVTPEYPNGTYYYLITADFPFIPRYFRGTPSRDFKLGPG